MWSRQISSSSGEGIVLDFKSGFKRLAKIQMKKLGLSAADCLTLRCYVCLFVCISISLILCHPCICLCVVSQWLFEIVFLSVNTFWLRVCGVRVFLFSQAVLEGPVHSPWGPRTHCLWLQLSQRQSVPTSKELTPISMTQCLKTRFTFSSVVLLCVWKKNKIIIYPFFSLRNAHLEHFSKGYY